MTTDKRQQARADMIGAAITCISNDGINGATVRNIAEQAGVNPAAISYYFGGIEQLIDAALHVTLQNAYDIDDIPQKPDDSYKTVLAATLSHWYDGAHNYPGITKAHFDQVINNRPGGAIVIEGFEKFIVDVYKLLVKHGLADTANNLAKLKTIFGSYMASLMFPSVLKPAEKKEDYISLLVGFL